MFPSKTIQNSAPVFSPILFLFSSAWHILVKALCKVKGLFRELGRKRRFDMRGKKKKRKIIRGDWLL